MTFGFIAISWFLAHKKFQFPVVTIYTPMYQIHFDQKLLTCVPKWMHGCTQLVKVLVWWNLLLIRSYLKGKWKWRVRHCKACVAFFRWLLRPHLQGMFTHACCAILRSETTPLVFSLWKISISFISDTKYTSDWLTRSRTTNQDPCHRVSIFYPVMPSTFCSSLKACACAPVDPASFRQVTMEFQGEFSCY